MLSVKLWITIRLPFTWQYHDAFSANLVPLCQVPSESAFFQEIENVVQSSLQIRAHSVP